MQGFTLEPAHDLTWRYSTARDEYMSLYDMIAIFTIMVGLAAVPSSSVALVVYRSATLDVKNGLWSAAGIVSGDLIFMIMALSGLTALSEIMGGFFALIKYCAGAYLIWFGIALIRSRNSAPSKPKKYAYGLTDRANSYLSGLFLTLGDVKAILFYASLFPVFIDVQSLSFVDMVYLAAITIISVGSVKAIYAILARKLVQFGQSRSSRADLIKPVAGTAMIGTGGYIILKS